MSGEILRRAAAEARRVNITTCDPVHLAVADWLEVEAGLDPTDFCWEAALVVARAYLGGTDA